MASILDLAWDSLAVLKLFSEVDATRPIDNLRAQKLTFLLELNGQKKGVRAAHMRFARFRFGPYSWQLPSLIEHLETGGFVEADSRALTNRGRYVLEYALPEMTGTAAQALDITQSIARDYGGLSGTEITKMVYAMRVPVHDMGGAKMRIKPLPMGVDIIHPAAVASLAEPVLDAEAILSDLQREFAIPSDALSLMNPAVQRAADQAIAHSLSRVMH